MKFSKQTIFTLLGILVIAGSIPLAVILVKQRQEIRKEAASSMDCGHWCDSQGTGYTDPYCKCGSSTASSGFVLMGCETTKDCTRCCAFEKGSGGGGSTSTSGGGTSSSKPKCGDWCATKVGHADSPWCECNKSTPASGYVSDDHTKDVSDCSGGTCYSFTKSSGGSTISSPEDYQQAWSHPVWGRWNTNNICSAPPPPAATPTTPPPAVPPAAVPAAATPTTPPPPAATPTMPVSCNEPCTTNPQCSGSLICSSGHCRKSDCVNEIDCTCPGPTLTPTVTPTITPTPTTPVSCNQTCTTNNNCQGSLICSSGYCRNADCTGETDCSCPGPTATPTPTATSTPGPTATPTTLLAQVTPTPVVELPKAGFALPTFGFVLGGILLIITSLVFIL